MGSSRSRWPVQRPSPLSRRKSRLTKLRLGVDSVRNRVPYAVVRAIQGSPSHLGLTGILESGECGRSPPASPSNHFIKVIAGCESTRV